MVETGGLSAGEEVRASFSAPPGPLVVALSGGADSAVTAWAASVESASGGSYARAVHVDHGLPHSPEMQAAAAAVAEELKMDFSVVEVSVQEGSSPEARARESRYGALLAQLVEGEWLLTGHTLDDQAETVLMRLARGTGPSGGAGIPSRRGRIVRPLLGVRRSAIRAAAVGLGLPFVDDPSNQDLSISRNVVRKTIVPGLESFAPGVRESLSRFADLVDIEEQEASARSVAWPVASAEGIASVPVAAVRSLSTPGARRLARRLLRALLAPYRGSYSDVAAVLDVARGESRREQVSGGHGVWVEGPLLVLGSDQPVAPFPATRLETGSTIQFGRFMVSSVVQEVRPEVLGISPWVEWFDADAVSDLVIRSAEGTGSVGLVSGTKPIKDALVEAKIPRRLRHMWPVVEADDRIVWVPGVRRADFGWISSATHRYLCLFASQEQEWQTSAH